MERKDFEEFAAMLDGVCSMLTRGAYMPNAASVALFFRALQRYPLPTVRKALEAHIADPQRGKFAPVPADVIAQIESAAAADDRPEADEAWAIAVQAADEASTVIWTAEIAEAWGVARIVHEQGDEVGARMAFKAAYNRLITAARKVREPASWSPSLGHDAAARDEALARAVESGRLPVAYLPAPRGPVAGLLELAQQRGCPADVRDRLLAIRQQIASKDDATSQDAADKLHTADLKAKAADAVSKAMRGGAQ